MDRLYYRDSICNVPEAVIARVRTALQSPAFRALFLPAFGKLHPDANKRIQFEQYLDQIDTREKFSDLMLSLEEPKPKDIDRLRSILRSIAPKLRDLFDKAKDTIRPLGGPSEKLGTNEKIGRIVDKINRTKQEESELLKNLFPRFAPEVGLKARTLRRYYEIEMRRRNSLRK